MSEFAVGDRVTWMERDEHMAMGTIGHVYGPRAWVAADDGLGGVSVHMTELTRVESAETHPFSVGAGGTLMDMEMSTEEGAEEGAEFEGWLARLPRPLAFTAPPVSDEQRRQVEDEYGVGGPTVDVYLPDGEYDEP